MARKTVYFSTLTLVAALTLVIAGTLLPSETIRPEAYASAKAVSIAEALLLEIASREFDEATTGGRRVYDASELTPTEHIGAEAGSFAGNGPAIETRILWPDSASPSKLAGYSPYDESESSADFLSRSVYDDIDDFDGYRRKVPDKKGGSFYAWVTVRYVHEQQPDIVATTPTFQKCITVTVTHPDLAVDESPSPGKIALKDIVAYRRFSPLPILTGSLP